MNDLFFLQADARAIPLRDECVQCVITSPPYWGLRKYAGAQGAEPYGLEPTIQRYLETTVDILREIRRVLRPDGVMFWNIGDSYCASPKGSMNGWDKSTLTKPKDGRDRAIKTALAGVADVRKEFGPLKPKDLCLIPERMAIAAQADGWWIRSIIIWAKPNPMPESCTDRPTDAYEHIIMLTKSERYFWDADAVREPSTTNDPRRPYTSEGAWELDGRDKSRRHGGEIRNGLSRETGTAVHGNLPGRGDGGAACNQPGQMFRNMRNVWTFPTQPYKGAHFATFPEEIPRRAILAATSERGACVHCEAPWRRVTEKHTHFESWEPGCKCAVLTKPCLVLDPFGGSGTTARVAAELNRRAVSLDLAYHDHAEKRTKNVQRRLVSA